MVKYTFNLPSINNASELDRMLLSIKKQAYKNYEVIVVDASNNDEVKKIVKKYGFKYIHSMPGLPHQRNIGFEAAKGNWIIWLDSDHYLSRNFLKELNKFIEKNDFKCISISHIFIAKTFFQKIILAGQKFHNRKLHKITKRMFHGGGIPIVLHKSIFKDIGKFDENLYYGEDRDYEIRIRKKYNVGYSEKSKVYIIAEEGLKDVYKQGRNYGSTMIRFLRKNPHPAILINMFYHAAFLPLFALLLFGIFRWVFALWLAIFIIECIFIAFKIRNLYGFLVPFVKLFRSFIVFVFFIKSFFKRYEYRLQR